MSASFYNRYIPFVKLEDKQYYANCPFHNDTNASFTVNMDSDAWYCHGCAEGGHYVEFIEKFYDIGEEQAKYVVNSITGRDIDPMPTEAYVEKCVDNLTEGDVAVWAKWGVNKETLVKYQIGKEDVRYTIPIRGRSGMLINVRKYLPPAKRTGAKTEPKVLGIAKCNDARFFPYENLMNGKDEVYILEGEKDCLAAISQGFNAVTSTGGSNLPKNEWELFRNKRVYLMGDTDTAGNRLKDLYFKNLKKIAQKIYWVDLPNKDFCEFWEEHHTNVVGEYIRGVQSSNSEENTVTSISDEDNSPQNLKTLTLSKSEHVTNINNWVELKGMSVVGVDPIIYTIPVKLKVRCASNSCTKSCPIGSSRDGISIDVEPRQLLQFMDAPDTAQSSYVQNTVNCRYVTCEAEKFTNIQKIIFQETASFVEGLEDASFEPRFGVYLYESSRLLPTVKYDFKALRVTNPRNQQNYYVITSAETVKNSSANLTLESINYFRTFAQKYPTCQELISAHYSVWERTLGIEQREDLFGAMLLTFLSVTEILWNGGTLKGWLDTMIIGDTRTGKSQMAQRLVHNLKIGSYINGENSKRTGVIGGVQRFGDSWVITWGAIPMNDKGLLVIDEASGLEVDDIKELSASRSSGAVTINKIAKGEARARTRLIWLSNPRSGRNIEDFYWKGFGAFQEFIPVIEDQARYDLVLSAAREDVKSIKGDYKDDIALEIDYYRQLIDFAWNVPKENVIIKDPSEVGQVVKELSEKFEGGPLFVGVAGHEKVLRLSCAIAILCGSIDNFNVVVEDKHIEMAREFFKLTYEKKTLDYSSYIEESKRAQRQAKENVAFVKCLISKHKAIKVLLTASRFRGNQISEVLGLDKAEASKILSELLQRGLMKISYNGTYQPDKLLVDIARQI